ncbi:MAG: class I SAM-dependent methyltransferase [Thaumarchaeota archaeon]|nr:class I SAM-dependent methyltransferase [Nitrososphaerota archaeon]
MDLSPRKALKSSILTRRGIGYDVPAEGYDELYGEEQIRKYSAFLSKLKEEIASLKLVADIGCGTCLLEKHLRMPGYKGVYLGIDISDERLRFAKSRAHGSRMLIQADAEHLPIRDNSMDLVACITVIHLLDLDKAVNELSRIGKRYTVISLLKKRADLKPKLLELLMKIFREAKLEEISIPDLKDFIFILKRV